MERTSFSYKTQSERDGEVGGGGRIESETTEIEGEPENGRWGLGEWGRERVNERDRDADDLFI